MDRTNEIIADYLTRIADLIDELIDELSGYTIEFTPEEEATDTITPSA